MMKSTISQMNAMAVVALLSVVSCILKNNGGVTALQNPFNFGPKSSSSSSSTSLPAPLLERRTLGTLSISPMGLGTLNLPLSVEQDDTMTDVLKTCYYDENNHNVNFVDTAEAYGFGKSEILVKNSLIDAGIPKYMDSDGSSDQKENDNDNGMIIATKFAPVPWRTEASCVVDACKSSAQRLGVSKIPLYQIHFPDKIQPFKMFGYENIKDTLYWDGIAQCYEMGLIENVGVSNYGPEYLLRCHEALSKRNVPIASNQINFSLARYKSSLSTMNMCKEMNIPVLAYFPLANGLLAGKYSEDNPPTKFPKSLTMKKYYESTKPLLKTLRDIANSKDKTMAQISLNWIMMKDAIPIPGARDSIMATDNFNSLGWTLSEDEMNRLDEASMISTMEFSSGGFELE